MGRWRATTNRRFVVVAAIGALLAACGSDGSADPESSEPAPATDGVAADSTRVTLTVPAPSLAGNLVGDPAEVDVVVQLPASYAASPDRRYPVVYYLAGFDEPASIASIGSEQDRLVEAGAVDEMILVGVSGDNALGGSFYVDSPVTGNWAQLVVEDVVGAVDREFRTLPSADSRGIAGFSMGGFGAFDLAMRHPDVFGAVYAASPGFFDPEGLAASQMFADPTVVGDFIGMQEALWAMPPGESAESMMSAIPGGDVRFALAYGMAFSPDPARAPYVEYPFATVGGARDDAVWARWEAGYGGIADEVDRFHDNLVALRGIVIDYGVNDEYEWIPPGCEFLHEQLDAAGVPHRVEQHDGGHGPIGPRAGAVMLPFFDEVLEMS